MNSGRAPTTVRSFTAATYPLVLDVRMSLTYAARSRQPCRAATSRTRDRHAATSPRWSRRRASSAPSSPRSTTQPTSLAATKSPAAVSAEAMIGRPLRVPRTVSSASQTSGTPRRRTPGRRCHRSDRTRSMLRRGRGRRRRRQGRCGWNRGRSTPGSRRSAGHPPIRRPRRRAVRCRRGELRPSRRRTSAARRPSASTGAARRHSPAAAGAPARRR